MAEEVGEVSGGLGAFGELLFKIGQRLRGIGQRRGQVLRGGGVEGLAGFEEELLGVRADLGASSCADDFFDLLPIAAIELQSWVKRSCTEEELLVLEFGPPAIGGILRFRVVQHISNLVCENRSLNYIGTKDSNLYF